MGCTWVFFGANESTPNFDGKLGMLLGVLLHFSTYGSDKKKGFPVRISDHRRLRMGGQ